VKIRAAALPAILIALALGMAGCAAPPAGERELSGDYFTHDPALVAGSADGNSSGDWFVYSTGDGQVADGNIQVRRSDDGEFWEYAGEVWQEKPEWLTGVVPGVANLWAPEPGTSTTRRPPLEATPR
jgi:arabinan endo-1,5-alpha-L-arabinosidase